MSRNPRKIANALRGNLEDSLWQDASKLVLWADSERLQDQATELQDLPDILGDAADGWYQVAKQLDAHGCGVLTLGRHKNKTRLTWPSDLADIARFVGEFSDAGAVPIKLESFRLDLPKGRGSVHLQLPSDLSPMEVALIESFVALSLSDVKIASKR